MSDITMENAPRNIVQLLALGGEQRVELFVLLCAHAGDELPPGLAAFAVLEPVQQADRLLQLLLQRDQKASGYTVVPIPLPVRTNRTSVNKQRWEEFAARVESVLNGMQLGRFNAVQCTKFDEHGLLVVGYKAPEGTQLAIGGQGGIVGQVTGPGRGPVGLSEVVREHVVQQASEAAAVMLIEAVGDLESEGLLKPKDVGELVQTKVRTMRIPMEAVYHIKKCVEAHARAHAEEGAHCPHTQQFKMLLEALDGYVKVNLC